MTPTADRDLLAARIRHRFAELRPGASVSELRELPGGHSGLTYRITVGEEELVVKAAPPGRPAVGRHDMLRQARVLRALEPTEIPTPRVITSDDTEPVWFAMTFVAGESIEPVLDGISIEPAVVAARMRAAAVLMAQVHAEEPRGLGVCDTALTPTEELSRWSRTLDAVPPGLIPGGDRLRDQLTQDVPDSLPPTFVHGDFRLGNMLCVDEVPMALIDWEIWSIGDPRTEMGWFQLFADHENFPGVGSPFPGLPEAAELIELYRSHSGLTADLTWFSTLGRFKMAVIMAHNLVRHREGRHDDPDQERLPATIEQLVQGGLLTHS